MTLHYFYILPLHNVHIVQYLYLATEQAGTYLQSPLKGGYR